ncbi:glutamyl-tRNA amidotransferase-like protein subunit A [Talaromyces proteolyticus]|uniref:Glutamyl-tRNA amidotransferase-like protein subunit A n=1 Tax=Talaromyces proteolyticus TaxID=1131652 RepID=A0AAD4PS95_9EURO|nr:glutamyl-tRNA amidotransferase-like protein subunit A [Talaromyces proteolyticus]KAH8690697.1 glutamyl-tRNA amidotransferase-like protein subunit A [Talaromyces proteolyticus]
MRRNIVPTQPSNSWQKIADQRRFQIDSRISPEWRVPKEMLTGKNLVDLPRRCGLMSKEELDITESNAVEIVSAIREGTLTAVDTTAAFCKRAAIAHQATNCLAEVHFEEALLQAAELDEYMRVHRRPKGMLHGLPISVKEHIKMKGTTATSGLIALANDVSDEDALIVRTFREQGAVFYVKTTNPQTLMAIETDSNLFGRTLNPHNTNLACGGSTGGEGALLSMRGSVLGIGTDIGGSIRVPGAFCGVYGFKPSIGRMPHSGLSGLSDGMQNVVGVIGPLALCLDDLELFCRAALNNEPWKDEPSLLEIPWKIDMTIPEKLRIGVMWSDGVVQPHPPITRALKQVVASLQNQGHSVIDWNPQFHQEIYDVVNEAYFLDGGAEYHKLLEEGQEPPVPIVKWLLDEKATRHYSVEDSWRVNRDMDKLRTLYAKQWNRHDVDAIICPANAAAASAHDENRYWGYTCVWNALDFPALVFPVSSVEQTDHWSSFEPLHPPSSPMDMWHRSLYDDSNGPLKYEGAPVSLQVVGRRLNGEKVLRITSNIVDMLKSPITASISKKNMVDKVPVTQPFSNLQNVCTQTLFIRYI